MLLVRDSSIRYERWEHFDTEYYTRKLDILQKALWVLTIFLVWLLDQNMSIIFVNNICIRHIRTVWHRKLYMKTWNIPGVEYFNTIGGWGGEGRGKCFNIIIMYTANIVIVKVQYLQITMYCIHNYKLNLNSGILLLKKGDLSISIKSLDCKTVGD